MDRAVPWLMVVASVVSVTMAAPAAFAQEASRPVAEQAAPGARTRIVMKVDGLACPFCAYGLEKKLRALDAVDSIEVKLNEGVVFVDLKPGGAVSEEVLDRVVKEAGFVLREIRRKAAVAPGP